ncbi:hypothetical protein [Flavobacterium sp. LB1P62]|uniref:hypothetical protein n=1 Tax=unclassified Flavobacterium TaxID=196869 RepID=UPI003AB0D709
MLNKEFKLFTNCIPVKGINRGIIIDIQRDTYHIIPNSIIDLINEYSGKKVYSLFQDFKNDKYILKKYMRYFLANELVILTNCSNQFPLISLDYERPNVIDTLTINIDMPLQNLMDILDANIDYLGVCCLRLVSHNFQTKKLIQILKFLQYSKIMSIVVYVKYTAELELELKKIKSKLNRIEVVFFDCDKFGVNFTPVLNNFSYEEKSLEKILSMKIENSNDFVFSIEGFSESLKFNSVYNRSLYIDQTGDIKRYIDDDLVFGKILESNIKDVIFNVEILNFWTISKDKIKVCNDCEFRYICPDGSIPFKEEQTDLLYSTITKCNYDPYKNLWNND